MSKTIELHAGEMFTSKRVFVDVLSLPPQGCNIGDMRRRMKVMDAVEAATDGELTLEDAEYEVLKSAYHSFPFRVAHRDLIAIADKFDKAA